jgi:membrane protein
VDNDASAATAATSRMWARRARELVEGSVLGDFLGEVRRIRLLDLAYTLSAQAFVALIPLLLVVTGLFTSSGDDALVAQQLVDRFGLAGAARTAVHLLFQTPGAGTGLYWAGLLITLYSAFVLSRRVGRAYAQIWDIRPLPPAQQWWRGLTWIAIQVTMVLLVSGLRSFGRDHGTALEITAVIALLLVWGGSEFAAQRLLTAGQVARERLVVAAGLVSLGRLGLGVWSAVYLPNSLARQSEQYGPIGVVFGLFTWIFASLLVLLVTTLLGAVLTSRPVATWLRPAT